MTDSIRSGPSALSLHTRPATRATTPATSSSPASGSLPGPVLRLHGSTSGDRYTPSAAAAPNLRDHLANLSVNRAALSTLGAVDSLLTAHYATTSGSSDGSAHT